METIGSIVDNKVIKEYNGVGWIYKNFDAFENKTDEICYISEHSGEDDDPLEKHRTYKYSDFCYIAKEFIVNNPEVEDWVKRSGYTHEIIAQNLFLSVDWQDPYTLIEEWESKCLYTY